MVQSFLCGCLLFEMLDTRTQLLIFFYKMPHQIACFADLLVHIPKHKSEFITGSITTSTRNKHQIKRLIPRVFFFQSFTLVLLINLSGIFAAPEKSHANPLPSIKIGRMLFQAVNTIA